MLPSWVLLSHLTQNSQVSDNSLFIRHLTYRLETHGSETHATGGRDGRQEGRERGYYHLHRHLNNPMPTHNYELLTMNS